MIGHYLLTLDEEAESVILTTKMGPGAYKQDDGTRCLIGAAGGCSEGHLSNFWTRPQHVPYSSEWQSMPSHLDQRSRVEGRYDALCEEFGTERVNRAIRNRILANQARRTLKGVSVLVSSSTECAVGT